MGEGLPDSYCVQPAPALGNVLLQSHQFQIRAGNTTEPLRSQAFVLHAGEGYAVNLQSVRCCYLISNTNYSTVGEIFTLQMSSVLF